MGTTRTFGFDFDMSTELLEKPEIHASGATRVLPVVRYSSESALRYPFRLIAEVFGDLWRNRELIAILFSRDLKAQFRQSYLGYLWLVAPPIMTCGVWLFLNSSRIVNIESSGMPYVLYVLIGTVFWQSFCSALEAPLKAFTNGKPVFMKLRVAPEAFVAAGTARAVFDFLISLALLVPVMIWLRAVPAPTAFLIPVVVFANCLLATAVGMTLIPVGGLYSDVQQATAFSLRFLMFFAPVVYPVPAAGTLRTVMLLNPVTPILHCARDWMVTGSSGSALEMLLWIPVSGCLLLCGVIGTRIVFPHLVARMGM